MKVGVIFYIYLIRPNSEPVNASIFTVHYRKSRETGGHSQFAILYSTCNVFLLKLTIKDMVKWMKYVITPIIKRLSLISKANDMMKIIVIKVPYGNADDDDDDDGDDADADNHDDDNGYYDDNANYGNVNDDDDYNDDDYDDGDGDDNDDDDDGDDDHEGWWWL